MSVSHASVVDARSRRCEKVLFEIHITLVTEATWTVEKAAMATVRKVVENCILSIKVWVYI